MQRKISPPGVRPRDHVVDRCPGALQTHQAADGALARVRIPGGLISAAQLEALAETAERHAAGSLELTVRGNLQVRGITDTAAVAEAVAAAGLLPSASHERVRNIVASPLSGRSGGLADVRRWVTDLDAALCGDPLLAALPGRFWFALDDGTGDVSALGADVGVQALAAGAAGDGSVALLLAGRDTGVRLAGDEVVPALTAVARRFIEVRAGVGGSPAWRVTELGDPGVLLADVAIGESRPAPLFPAGPAPAQPPVGWITQDDGRVALGAAVPLGVLPARVARFVAAVAAPVVVTPWRSLLICDLDGGVADAALRVLAPLGLVFDKQSRWLQVSACVGSPGCDRSRADVRAEATRTVQASNSPGEATGPVHFAGCERACGRPAGGPVLVATGEGFEPLLS